MKRLNDVIGSGVGGWMLWALILWEIPNWGRGDKQGEENLENTKLTLPKY